jgi:serine/threonine protein kinase
MQYVEGQNLHALVRERGRFSLTEATKLVREVASALGTAHSQGVIHRDIKPDNILVTPQGVAKLADFGLAKDLASDVKLTAEGAMIGTPLYIAPEIGRAKDIDGRVDLYSLGITYYYLLTGEQPLRPFTAMDILSAKAHDKIKDPLAIVPDLPRLVRNVLGKLLEKDRDQRYPDAATLIQDLDCILQGRPVSAGAPNLWGEGPQAGATEISATGSQKGSRRGGRRPDKATRSTRYIQEPRQGFTPGQTVALVTAGVFSIGLLATLIWHLTSR